MNGEYHRIDGPAVELADGTKYWYVKNKKHRTDGPAVEQANGTKVWYVNGKRHRTDGPASERADGTKWWYVDDLPHRPHGPAVEWADGGKDWYINGKRHRTDGAAIECASGAKWWYVDGLPHRPHGPAFEGDDGTMEWWVNGEKISVPYSYVLTAAFTRGLPMPEEAMSEIIKATRERQTNGEQLGALKAILAKHWPMHVKEILVTLFSSSDPAIKHLAFSILDRETQQKSMPGVTDL